MSEMTGALPRSQEQLYGCLVHSGRTLLRPPMASQPSEGKKNKKNKDPGSYDNKALIVPDEAAWSTGCNVERGREASLEKEMLRERKGLADRATG